jgi:hypothetical protein
VPQGKTCYGKDVIIEPEVSVPSNVSQAFKLEAFGALTYRCQANRMSLSDVNAVLRPTGICDQSAVGNLRMLTPGVFSPVFTDLRSQSQFVGSLVNAARPRNGSIPSLLVTKQGGFAGNLSSGLSPFNMANIKFVQSVSSLGGNPPDDVTCSQTSEGIERARAFRSLMIFYQ